ncbi:MAG: hypothetical protein QMD05_05560, partial [Candidatus Brocadiaceae bacterium]|nr:hypothetical protein [Candidatus Brocadiaceae bacterium]
MKLALIGSNGQLGHDLQRVLSCGSEPAGSVLRTVQQALHCEGTWQVIPLTHQDIEITNPGV